jgi:hypothetical protein
MDISKQFRTWVRSRGHRSWLACALLPALSCGFSPETENPDEPTALPFRNGTAQTDTAGHIRQTWGCSGELVTNSWYVTARHCIGANREGSTVTMGNQTRVVAMGSVTLHPKWDAALARVTTPFTMNGSTSGYRKALFVGPNAFLKNKHVTCIGYGPTGTSVTGLNSGTFTISDVLPNQNVDPDEAATIILSPTNGQGTCPGDSGSPCFLADGSVAGMVNSGTDVACTANPAIGGQGLGIESYREWIFSVVGEPEAPSTETMDDILLTGPGNWLSMPQARAAGSGQFTVTNGSVWDFGSWSNTAGAFRVLSDINGDGRKDVVLTGVSGWSRLRYAISQQDNTYRIRQFS